MEWQEAHLKIGLMASFVRCLDRLETDHQKTYHFAVTTQKSFISLTCSCGVACTLHFSEETTALWWASQCLTTATEAVLGCIVEGILLSCAWSSPTSMQGTRAQPGLLRTLLSARKRDRNGPGIHQPYERSWAILRDAREVLYLMETGKNFTQPLLDIIDLRELE